jgi:hypothetical protein
VEPARFYLNLLGYPFGRAPWSRAVALAALLAVTQGANAAGFLWEGARQARSRPSRR